MNLSSRIVKVELLFSPCKFIFLNGATKTPDYLPSLFECPLPNLCWSLIVIGIILKVGILKIMKLSSE